MNTRPLVRRTHSGGLSRRSVISRLGASGLVAGLLGAVGRERSLAAQESAPAGWRTEHLEVEFTAGVSPGVSITSAGSGPPQRGDWFYIDSPLYMAGDAGGTEVGTYQCFGAWTHAATDEEAPDRRLTTVQFRMEDGSIMGLINELGVDPESTYGAVQGGTGVYTGALGTFQQITQGPLSATPAASDTPGPVVVRASFELMLPNLG